MSDERKLASIQRITNVRPIEGADKIVVCNVLGWNVVVRRDEFKQGDLCVYLEIDSIVPEGNPEFEFLREKHFRIKTIKLRGQVSQGLCVPLSILPKDCAVKEGKDVTQILGVTKYETASEKRERKQSETQRNRITKFLGIGRFIDKYFRDGTVGGSFPSFIRKTDEVRLQVMPDVVDKLLGRHDVSVTEKLDGQSATYFVLKNPSKISFLQFWKQKYIFGVCSRTVYRKVEDNSSWWRIANKTHIKEKLLKYATERGVDLAYVQGEIIGPGIQGNPYKLEDNEFYAFNVYDGSTFLDNHCVDLWCLVNSMNMVPILQKFGGLQNIGYEVDDLEKYARGKSQINKEVNREGVVVRSKNISFKVINTDYLLKEAEEAA